MFGSIMNKIFHHPAAAAAPGGQAQAPASGTAASAPASTPASAGQAPASAPGATPAAAPAAAAQPAQSVDVGAVLAAMAKAKGGGGNYQTSIVDLLKLLDLDSSLEARKTLGQELGVHAGADGSAEQNIALHKAVVAKLAENGGKIPDSMRA
jgi:hypothetical protein